MQYRTLGNTGLTVSTVSMGCWGLGGQWGEVSVEQGIAALHRALDLGVTFFDTADAYGEPMGRSEAIMGQAFAGMRDRVVIATKVGNWGRRYGHPLPYTHVTHIVGCCDASLYRLKTDYLDLYQCHIDKVPNPDVFLEAFELLKQQGKIRAYGLSTHDFDALQRFNHTGACQTLQVDYSLLNRAPERDMLPYCAERRIGVIARGSLAMGVLTGKFTPDTVFGDWVRERWNSGAAHERFVQQVRHTEELRRFATGGRTLADVALAFVLAHPAVTCTIPGMKSPAQAEANARAADVRLSDAELADLRAVSDGWAVTTW